MRLLFATFSVVPFGSNDRLYYGATRRALRAGHDVLVSPYDWGESNAPEYDALVAEGARIHRRRQPRRHPSFVRRQLDKARHKIASADKAFEFIQDYRPDGMVFSDPGTYHMLSVPGFADYVLASGIPYVTISQFNDENSAIPESRADLARRFFSHARVSVFVSERNCHVARRQLCLPLTQAVVLDNPPNIDALHAEPYPHPRAAAFASVARLECAVKGQAIMLEILSQPRWRSRDWTLSLVGSGPDESYVRRLIDHFGLAGRVTLRGQVSDIRGVWREHELLLLCSTGEGKPLALAEAMVCGRPAVVTDVGGNAELISDGVTGFVADGPTPHSFGAALERAWQQRAAWEQMGQRAHTDAAERLRQPPDEKLLAILETAFSRSVTSVEAVEAHA